MKRFGLKAYGGVVIQVVVAVALLAVALCPVAMGDGCKFSGAKVKVLPEIPIQRAVVVFDGEEETLIIESSLKGAGQDFAWVVPVPATPTDFKVASVGLIPVLSQQIQPDIEHKRGRQWVQLVLLCTFAFWLAVWAGLLIWFRPESLKKVLISLAVCCFLAVLSMPVTNFIFRFEMARGMNAGFESASGVNVEDTQRIGNYDIAVLDAETPEALDRWLSENGYMTVPPEGGPIVADYIASDWRFVAAKLRREGEGLSKPHPLSITFPVTTPVYPMRLTALPGSDLYLELFVVADGRASHQMLTMEACDRFSWEYDYQTTNFLGAPQASYVVGETHRFEIGHPAARSVMPDGCVLTKLTGTIAPEQMKEDYVLELDEYKPYRQHLYAEAMILPLSMEWGLWVWIFGIPVALVGVHGTSKKRQRVKYLIATGSIIILGGATGLGVYETVPKVEVRFTGDGQDSIMLRHSTFSRLVSILPGWYGGSGNLTNEEIVACIQFEFDNEHRIGGLGIDKNKAPLRLEDSPGHFTMDRVEDGVELTFYEDDGRGYAFLWPSKVVDEEVPLSERLPYAMHKLGYGTNSNLDWPPATEGDLEMLVEEVSNPDISVERRLYVLSRLSWLTGQNLDPDAWAEWYAENKNRPRREWLLDVARGNGPYSASAILRLTYMGDPVAAEFWKEGFSEKYLYSVLPKHMEAVGELMRVFVGEGGDISNPTWIREQPMDFPLNLVERRAAENLFAVLKAGDYNFDVYQSWIDTFAESYPDLAVEAALADLAEIDESEPLVYVRLFYNVRLLARITRTVPPKNLEEPVALAIFCEKARSAES